MEKGLRQHEVLQLRKQYGKNLIETENNFSILKLFFSQFPTTINAILVLAGVFSLFINNVLDASFIFVVIFINACFGFIQEYRAQKSLEKLKAYTAPTARVIRDGKETQLLASLLVPNDIVVVAEGDRIPADGYLIEASGMEVDEAILTGESMAVQKNKDDTLLMGTLVIRGNGTIKITAIGMKTQFGSIASTLATLKEDKPPLQQKLDKLGKFLSYIALLLGLLIIPIGLFHGEDFLPLLLVSASIAVAAIPEGLPAVVTIAFAVGMNRMVKHGAIVRKMNAIETLGAVQILLSDKTGTITQNAMRVKKYWLHNKATLPSLITACYLGNTASLIEKGNGKDYEIAGDQTDGALLLWAKTQPQVALPKDSKSIEEHVFNNETQTVTTVWDKLDGRYVFVRGAPEAIIQAATLSLTEKKLVYEQFEKFAGEGFRVIAFGTKHLSKGQHHSRKELEQKVNFIGFLCLYDPPRAEIAEAVRKSLSAGIQAIMVTGDNENTALNLAKEIGLISKDEDVVTGDELAKMTDKEVIDIVKKTRIFARTRPEDKLRIVTILKQQGIVVGVTGDGVNDALALKKADVGIAMGLGGTDVAKEAADIILTDNNFATMIRAIEQGRVIYKNITNAIVYLISGNLAEISLVFLSTLLNLPFPLLPTQILWINIVTDSLPALALATGSKDETVLSHKPRNPQDNILTKDRILTILLIGLSMTTILLATYVYLLPIVSHAVARTAVFNLLVYLHLIFVLILGRHSLRKGHVFLIFTVILILSLQILITYSPFFQQIFHTVPY